MTALNLTVLRDEASLLALGPAWDALEARSLAAGHPAPLYASHRYVRLAWQHLREAADQLFVVTLGDAGRLHGVLPLVLRPARALRMPIRELSPIGSWEGERPGLLCDGDADSAWAAIWAGLVRERAAWHVLALRELDDDVWPLRGLVQGDGGFRLRLRADNNTHWQRLAGAWADHESSRPAAARDTLARARAELAAHAPQLRQRTVDDPASIDAAFSDFLALEATHAPGPASAGLYLLGHDAARVAFYRAFLPAMAARGEAQIRLLLDGDNPIAALIRLRSGSVWIERHAAEHAGFAAQAPAVSLLLGSLAQGWGEGMRASDLLLLPDASGRTEALGAWYDEVRPTSRLTVWNLHSRLALCAALDRLRGR